MESLINCFSSSKPPEFSDFQEYLGIWGLKMRKTPQEPEFHGEGNVLIHTEMVCNVLTKLPEYQQESPEGRAVLYLAALFHDIGKVSTTEILDGSFHAPGHSRVGASLARTILWEELGLCGTPEKQNFRESICSLIRLHSLPPRAISDQEGEKKLISASADGSLIPGLTLRRLCTLARADTLGRLCKDQQELLENIALCQELAEEGSCYDGAYPFPSEFTRYAYLSGRRVQPGQPLYDDTWGKVILMSGLPGTGKDTWIQEHRPDLPMISLDEIRRAMNISPLANQSPVVAAGRELAREYLRKKQAFIWNATDLSDSVRKNQVSLFTDYGASVEIIYLETDLQEQLRRNADRVYAVAEDQILRMLTKLQPPSVREAQSVRWICV